MDWCFVVFVYPSRQHDDGSLSFVVFREGGPIRVFLQRQYTRLTKRLPDNDTRLAFAPTPVRSAPEWVLRAVRRPLTVESPIANGSLPLPRPHPHQRHKVFARRGEAACHGRSRGRGCGAVGHSGMKQVWDVCATLATRSIEATVPKSTSSVEECVRLLYLADLNQTSSCTSDLRLEK